jgi:hypothetical protein
MPGGKWWSLWFMDQSDGALNVWSELMESILSGGKWWNAGCQEWSDGGLAEERKWESVRGGWWTLLPRQQRESDTSHYNTAPLLVFFIRVRGIFTKTVVTNIQVSFWSVHRIYLTFPPNYAWREREGGKFLLILVHCKFWCAQNLITSKGKYHEM